MSRFVVGGRLRVRAGFVAITGLVALAGCAADTVPAPVLDPPTAMYAETVDNEFPIKAINLERVDPRFLRQVVSTPQGIAEEPGVIVVDPANRFLYLTLPGRQSMRYGIGVGRDGFAWSGVAEVREKRIWPKWFPPKEMIARDPTLKPYVDGMDGGPRNPLGARALYLWQDNQDTLYRLHGTIDPSSIGKAVSSGCVRLFNQDIIDLFDRVPVGTKVIVLPATDETIEMTT